MGLLQRSALSPCLFAVLMDRLTDEVRHAALWTVMSAADIVLCAECKEQVEENQERWRFAWEWKGMQVNRRRQDTCVCNKGEVAPHDQGLGGPLV